jgi:2-polyprenyl-6-methoxyphenol hydroxylase-like FAD-dependent oxidoreductase
VTAEYVAGCDGGRSTVRRLAGIPFPGTASTQYTLLGDVEPADPADLPFGPTVTGHGSVFVVPRPGYVRVLTAEPEPPEDRDAPVTLAYLQAVVDRALGRHVTLTRPRWLTRFGDAARQAERYVAGRVILVGDAAHIHPPAGAVGVNVAVDDAMNLGWKLAAAVEGWAPRALLETYHTERHAAGARVLRNTLAQALLGKPDVALAPLRDLFAEISQLPSVQAHLAGLVTGMNTCYPMPGAADHAHPWLGRLAPNLELTGGGGSTSVAELLSSGRGVLLDLAGTPALRALAAAWQPRVTFRSARCATQPDLGAILIRPDGHTAWACSTSVDEHIPALRRALVAWFG